MIRQCGMLQCIMHVGTCLLLFDLIGSLRTKGLTILIVEQNVHHVLHAADRAYVLENGYIVMEGKGSALLNDERLKTAYLGL